PHVLATLHQLRAILFHQLRAVFPLNQCVEATATSAAKVPHGWRCITFRGQSQLIEEPVTLHIADERAKTTVTNSQCSPIARPSHQPRPDMCGSVQARAFPKALACFLSAICLVGPTLNPFTVVHHSSTRDTHNRFKQRQILQPQTRLLARVRAELVRLNYLVVGPDGC